MAQKILSVPEEGESGTLKEMYKDYFLDYASYVILERAVPSIGDGLKPVQRRILHAMKKIDDGRYHKVANIIGQTMQYHPHGDAAIGDALVNMGQKDLLIDPQGNWGDSRTGDGAAAPRYIEARLTKFALEVAFNNQTTEWQLSYDGRNQEPIQLPMKFPMLLAQGAEGIAVGLSTKILPHNFIELIQASIKILQGKRVKIYPDFLTGGMANVADYNQGKRGGKIRVRTNVEQLDKKTLAIRDLPHGITTSSLIDSIVKANDKGKIKIKKVVDNTAKNVEILVEMAPGVSPDVTVDALYAFTQCEISISPNACVIIEDKPHFITVTDLLQISTENTRELLKRELEIKLNELEEKWHFASLEKIFIQNRIYHQIEECETWEAVIETIDRALKDYVATPSDPSVSGDNRLVLNRDITLDDITRLTEIKIKRISRYNSFKADELLEKVIAEIDQVKHHLAHLTDFAIAYFQNLLDKHGKGKERKTKITTFEQIEAAQVVANNTKLYVNLKEGFIGWGLKKDDFVKDCSDIDDIVVFRKDGKFQVVRMAEKAFVGKDIVHVDVWKKGDDRTTYNMIYLDGGSGRSMAKRFNVKSITRDKPYDLTAGNANSKTLYFTAHPNGESEVVNIQLSQGCKAKKKVFDFDFSEIAIKGRVSKGNIVTRYPVRKISQIGVGKSTLGAVSYWMDSVSGRINKEERGWFLGKFDTGDHILVLYKNGSYELAEVDANRKFDAANIISAQRFDEQTVISAVHYDSLKKWTLVKRFQLETTSTNQAFSFISEHVGSALLFATTTDQVNLSYAYKSKNKKVPAAVVPSDFVDIKGWKSQGNKLCDGKAGSIKEISDDDKNVLEAGDTINFDL